MIKAIDDDCNMTRYPVCITREPDLARSLAFPCGSPFKCDKVAPRTINDTCLSYYSQHQYRSLLFDYHPIVAGSFCGASTGTIFVHNVVTEFLIARPDPV
jgi:hypothetical protein